MCGCEKFGFGFGMVKAVGEFGGSVPRVCNPRAPFGVGGLNSIALALVPYRHVSICS